VTARRSSPRSTRTRASRCAYNPFAQRQGLRKALGFLWEFTRLNRRMHNKSLTVDGALTVVGGRNIGDEYFDANAHLNFRDRDVLVAGPVVAQTAAMFASFWDSPLARPVAEVADGVRAEPPRQQARLLLQAARRLEDLHGSLPADRATALARLGRREQALVWAPARLVHDDPPELARLAETDLTQSSARALYDIAQHAQREILIESAYLVMDDDTLEGVKALRARGTAVRALTNSLASNDVTANHAAYARRREAMLASGVELDELRPDAAACRDTVLNPSACGPGHVYGLHAKTFVFDRRLVYVGSLNLNLRSRFLNAESGVVIESPALAARIAADIERNMAPQNSWRVELDARGGVHWLERAADGTVVRRLDSEPAVPLQRRAVAAAIAALPLEKYL
jgi:putative cardiolipin synthase